MSKTGFFDVVRADLLANNISRKWSFPSVLAAYIFDIGFACVLKVRVMHMLKERGGRFGHLLSRIIWRSIVMKHQCYISIDSKIGPGFTLPHPVGIVVGDGVKIGKNVVIYQNVTLGRANRNKQESPVVMDGAILYAGSVVAGNVIVAEKLYVPANFVVSRNSLHKLRGY